MAPREPHGRQEIPEQVVHPHVQCQLCDQWVREEAILAHIHHQHPETRLAQFLERLRPGGLPEDGEAS